MGLDIYFYRYKRNEYDQYKESLENWNNARPESTKVTNEQFSKLSAEEQTKVQDELNDWYKVRPDASKFGEKEIGYFRKVNFLIPFFGYSDNCEDLEIPLEDIETLLEFCRKILKHKSKKLAEHYLPTTSGFFFGSTEYDEYYFDDVKEVREWCKAVLKECDKQDINDEEYIFLMNCWW